ncbi:MAG: hypothetical protein WBP46_20520 [Thiolinea sp.]
MVDTNNAPANYVRSTGQQIAFWILWILLLIPLITFLLMIVGGGIDTLITLAVLLQMLIHGFALKWFLEPNKPFSKVMLMLLGGTGALYFLVLGSCAIMLFNLSGAGIH